jgi:hypothetical protein
MVMAFLHNGRADGAILYEETRRSTAGSEREGFTSE